MKVICMLIFSGILISTVIASPAVTSYISYDSSHPTILHFSAKKHFDQVKFEWATSKELNTKYFAVERSANNKLWNTCARIDAAGTTDSLSEYQAIDYTPAPEQIFYRLKQVNWDGSAVYSQSITVVNKLISEVNIYPIPAKDFVNIDMRSMPPGKALIRMTDIFGKILKEVSTTDALIRLDFPTSST